MLKLASYPSEILGNALLSWWEGAAPASSGPPARPLSDSQYATGAAPVFAVDGAAILMARASEEGTLLRLLDHGRDDEAIRVIAGIAAALHAPRVSPPPQGLPLLEHWFGHLSAAASQLGGVFHDCDHAARRLLATQADYVVLHGDLHHENVLDFSAVGWRAIDPKGVWGERYFDYVHHLFDPDDQRLPDLDVLERQLALTAEVAGLVPLRLRLWLLAWAGLSAAWWLEDGKSAGPALAVATWLGAWSSSATTGWSSPSS